jgi:hypothetical protein
VSASGATASFGSTKRSEQTALATGPKNRRARSTTKCWQTGAAVLPAQDTQPLTRAKHLQLEHRPIGFQHTPESEPNATGPELHIHRLDPPGGHFRRSLHRLHTRQRRLRPLLRKTLFKLGAHRSLFALPMLRLFFQPLAQVWHQAVEHALRQTQRTGFLLLGAARQSNAVFRRVVFGGDAIQTFHAVNGC